ncbi:MAG TPA: hypothetical protein VEF06_02730 [Bryobacteraceae bacterium]|nr:hypothetical protein [Bryobacteraceae bacterium]
MHPADPRAIYSARLHDRTGTLAALSQRSSRIAALRLLVFLAAAAIAWFAIGGQLVIWWIAAPIAAFIALVSRQARLERDIERTRRAIRFFEHGIARLEHRWQGSSENGGIRFLDPHHPYAADLDLFGRASLFELLSTARTRGGEARLASWLLAPASPEELRARHEAVGELRPLLDLRERLAVLGDDFRAGVKPEELAAWAGAPARPWPGGMRLLALILSAGAFVALIWLLGTDLADRNARIALLAAGLIEAAFAVPMRARILETIAAVEEPAHDLDLLSQILETLEAHQFQSPLLKKLRGLIQVDCQPASRRIARLRRLADMIDSRENPIVRAVGPVILWTTQLGMAVEAWRAENGPQVGGWLEAVSEIEALSALAGYAWEHPEDPFPGFAPAADACFEAEALGHPLLAGDRCVRNSVSLVSPVRLLIVSGSNMSGKSTLLRAIGVNTVLALAGAPVRAARLRVSPLSLGASIRTMDSLEEGNSRFMAEILRLKQILELPAPSLFLVDELLGGTNSHDRAVGSEGLIRALLERGAIGLATTHDLSLARVADALAPAGANVHFEDRLENGKLVFDYRMRPGIVTRSNALDLMRAVGLNV